jgi:type IV secretion system protein VirB10
MPRHLQQWVLVGTAVVMVGILAFSGSPTKPRATAAPSPATSAVDPDQHRIEDYQRRIQEQAQRLAAEQAQLQLTKEAVATSAGSSPSGAARAEPERRSPTAGTPPDRAAREDRARVADNVAFSKPDAAFANIARVETAGLPASTITATLAPALVSSTSPTPSAMATPVAALGAPAPITDTTVATHVATPLPTDRRSPAAGEEPRYRLFEGTLIETVLTNRLDGTFTGPVNCLVSVPVYASDQQQVIIHDGSRVLGE